VSMMLICGVMVGWSQQADSTLAVMDSIAASDARILLPDDSSSVVVKTDVAKGRDWSTWRPKPQKARCRRCLCLTTTATTQ
jgi:hypothetical protein